MLNNVLQRKEFFERRPEDHPKYSEEWKLFWERRYKELQVQGRDPNSHDFQVRVVCQLIFCVSAGVEEPPVFFWAAPASEVRGPRADSVSGPIWSAPALYTKVCNFGL